MSDIRVTLMYIRGRNDGHRVCATVATAVAAYPRGRGRGRGNSRGCGHRRVRGQRMRQRGRVGWGDLLTLTYFP